MPKNTKTAEQNLAQSLVIDALRSGKSIEDYARKNLSLLPTAQVDRIITLARASNLR